MPSEAIQLIRRVKSLVDEHQDFFDAVAEWYENARACYQELQKCRKLVARLLTPASTGARVSVTVNGHQLAGAAVTVTPRARDLTWSLPAGVMAAGLNELCVFVEPAGTGELHAVSAAALAAPGLPRQAVDLSVPKPAAAPRLELALCCEARYRGGNFLVKRGGSLVFTLRLDAAAPVTFTLGLATGGADALLLELRNELEERLTDELQGRLKEQLRDLLEEVMERVQVKRRELDAQRKRAVTADPEQAALLAEAVDALHAYCGLHEAQIAPAFCSGPAVPLANVIARTGNPDRLIREVRRAVLVQAAPAAAAPAVVLPAAVATVVPIRAAAGLRPVRAAAAAPAAAGGISWPAFLLVTALILAPVLYVVGTTDGARAQLQQWFAGITRAWGQGGKAGAADPPPVIGGFDAAASLKLLHERKGVRPGVVEVALLWDNKNDLDLHVIDPSGEEIYYGRRQSRSGGHLDMDMNVGYAGASNRPAEHVVWEAKAPAGTYKVFVYYFANHGRPDTKDPTHYAVQVKVHGKVQWFSGELTFSNPKDRRRLVTTFTVEGKTSALKRGAVGVELRDVKTALLRAGSAGRDSRHLAPASKSGPLPRSFPLRKADGTARSVASRSRIFGNSVQATELPWSV